MAELDTEKRPRAAEVDPQNEDVDFDGECHSGGRRWVEWGLWGGLSLIKRKLTSASQSLALSLLYSLGPWLLSLLRPLLPLQATPSILRLYLDKNSFPVVHFPQ